jgi:hypothetical protein
MLPALLRAAAAFGGAGADKVALHVRQAAENGDHQSAGAGAGVGPMPPRKVYGLLPHVEVGLVKLLAGIANGDTLKRA